MPPEDNAAVRGRAREGVRERHDSSDALPATELKRAREEPGLAVPWNVVEKHEPAEFGALEADDEGTECERV